MIITFPTLIPLPEAPRNHNVVVKDGAAVGQILPGLRHLPGHPPPVLVRVEHLHRLLLLLPIVSSDGVQSVLECNNSTASSHLTRNKKFDNNYLQTILESDPEEKIQAILDNFAFFLQNRCFFSILNKHLPCSCLLQVPTCPP